MRFLLLLLLLIGCAGAATAGTVAPVDISSATADVYPVVMRRTPVVGVPFTVTLTGQSQIRTVVSLGGQVAQDTRVQRSIVMVAEVTVQEVNAQGKPTLTEFTVISCQHGDNNEQLLAPGSVLVVTAVPPPAEGSIRLRGGELSEAQVEVLDVVINTHASTRTDDDLFGTNVSQAVGNSWPMNAALAAADLSDMPSLHVDAEGMRGRTTFESLAEVDGVMCQNLVAEMNAENIRLEGLPEGAVIQRSSLVGQMSASLPLDVSAGRMRSAEHMTMSIVIQIPTPNGPASMTVDSVMTKSMVRHR